jgi:dihydrofolate synthase / folylpolyglutamate synthase
MVPGFQLALRAPGMTQFSDPVQQAFERLFGPEFGHGKTFDLARLGAALDALGGPQLDIAPVIHVAGTNGKGSTIAFLRAIVEAAGVKVHAFTKPHLFELRERFLVGSDLASEDALIEMAEDVARICGRELTQFDAQIAVAMTLFCENVGEIILLEAGMGGRDDSTNLIPSAVSIITPIGLDHQDVLGGTLAEIAAHKAGILKPDIPAFVARQTPEAMAVIEARAEEIGAPLFRAGMEWDGYASHGRLVVQTGDRALDLPLPALQGRHQIDNAGLACAALLIKPFEHLPPLTDDAFARGVATAAWIARLQPLTRGALSAPIRALGGEVWVDGGHNAHAAQALARALGDMKRRRDAPAIAIIGVRARKDAESFIGALAGAVDHVIAAPLAEPHVAPAAISAICGAMGVASSEAQSLEAAMQNAAQFPAPRVLICGSFLLAAEALQLENA